MLLDELKQIKAQETIAKEKDRQNIVDKRLKNKCIATKTIPSILYLIIVALEIEE